VRRLFVIDITVRSLEKSFRFVRIPFKFLVSIPLRPWKPQKDPIAESIKINRKRLSPRDGKKPFSTEPIRGTVRKIFLALPRWNLAAGAMAIEKTGGKKA
jgi:hypothetical protein